MILKHSTLHHWKCSLSFLFLAGTNWDSAPGMNLSVGGHIKWTTTSSPSKPPFPSREPKKRLIRTSVRTDRMWDGLRVQAFLLCLIAMLWITVASRGPQERGHHRHLASYRHRERRKDGHVLHRSKRGWVWNQFFVIEEYTGPDPVLVGRVRGSTDGTMRSIWGQKWAQTS